MNLKDKIKTEYILKALVVLALLVSSYSILTYGQTVIHSDTATATLLARAQLRYGQLFPDSWCYINSDLWVFAPNLFVLPFTVIFKDQSLARMAGSLLMVLCTCFVIYLHSSRLFKSRSWLIAIPMFLLATFGEYDTTDPYSYDYDMILYQAAYTLFILCIVLITWLAYKAMKSEKKRMAKVIALMVIILVISMGGMRFLAEIAVPFSGTLIVLYILKKAGKSNEKVLKESEDPGQSEKYEKQEDNRDSLLRLALNIGMVAVPSLLGCLISRHIYNGRSIITTSTGYPLDCVPTVRDCFDNLIEMILNCFRNFGYSGGVGIMTLKGIRNLVSMVMCIVIVFVIPVLQAKKISEESDEIKYFFIFGLIHNAEMFLMCILFGMTTYRYFLTSVFIFEIISSVYIYEHYIKTGSKAANYLIAAFAAAICVYSLVMLSSTVGWRQKVDYNRAFCDELVSRGLSKGYAPYWSAYKYEVYSDGRIRMMSLSPDRRIVEGNDGNNMISQDWWLTDANRYTPEEGIRTFFISDDTIDEDKKQRLFEIYGEPVDEFDYNNLSVYIWDYDMAERMINGYADGRLTPNDLYATEGSTVTVNEIILSENGLVHGPYLPLEKGKYRITVRGKGLADAAFEVRSYGLPGSITCEETERDDDHISVNVAVSDSVDDFTIRLINTGAGDVFFEEAEVVRK